MKSVSFVRILLSFVFVFLLVGAARAANFTVNNNADTSDVAAGNGICADAAGNCTLRAAVQEANALSGNDSINFAASLINATITLTTGVEIPISGLTGTLEITGHGANKLTIDGGAGSNRIFSTNNAATVTISRVTLQGGGSAGGVGPDGGAIFASGGTLVLNAVLVQNNNSGDRGGGIFLSGGANHRILNSTISNNSAITTSGGLLLENGTLFVANTTISGNTIISGNGQAGGVFLSSSTATFRNSTITNNTADAGGGIEVAGSSFNLGNTIVAGNNARNYPEILNFNTTTSAGNNFIGDSVGDSTATNAPITYQPSDIRDQNPLLGILQNNGGPTPTHALTAGGLAINAGDNAKAVDPFDNSPLTADQRFFAPRIAGGPVDIGAYEFLAAPPTAANVSIAGRVTTGDGSPLAGVVVRLSGARTDRTITNSQGFYEFDDLEANGFYVVTPARINFTFSPATHACSLVSNNTDAVFTANLEAVITASPLDTPEFFVRQHYLDFLSREPDQSGFNFWSDQMFECGNDAGCVERRRINVSAAYFLSIEFQQTGGLVDGLYRASYGVRPQFAEFMPDTATVGRNVIVGSGDWARQLETNKQAFVAAFVNRAAFRGAYDGLSSGDYVDALMSHAGVSFTLGERETLVSSLTDGTATRADVLRQIAENDRFAAAKRNEVFVMMEYFGYLRRDPDESGFHFWLNKLNEFEGNFERAEMVKAFILSGEYRRRFGL
ncbi:MAG: choice-of-anchor Q domain-containing protein [Acidobacteriota bacterium]